MLNTLSVHKCAGNRKTLELCRRYEAHIINYMNLLNINKGLLVLCMQLLCILLGIFSQISVVKSVKKIICNSVTPYFQNMLSFHYKGITVIAFLFFVFFLYMGKVNIFVCGNHQPDTCSPLNFS